MTNPGFRPTHVVPGHGMPAWEAPDPARPTVPLDPLLPVQLMERRGDWAYVLCANGWSAWVDGRHLVDVPQDPPAPEGPLTRTADPRPLLARADETLARYRAAVEELAAWGPRRRGLPRPHAGTADRGRRRRGARVAVRRPARPLGVRGRDSPEHLRHRRRAPRRRPRPPGTPPPRW